MAEFVRKLRKTQRGNKSHLLVFGYIHDQFQDFLDDIIIECLKYYFEQDKFDQNGYDKTKMKYNEETNSMKQIIFSDASAYLLNIMEKKDLYSFKFKILKHDNKYGDWRQTIGIWRVNHDNKSNIFDSDFSFDDGSFGLTNLGEILGDGQNGEYSNYCSGFDTGDVIEMFVDFDKLQLYFTLNGKSLGKAADIDANHKYRAAISLSYKDDEIQLL